MISIIIPVYNAEKYIKRCIDSIINQTYTNLEIIIVNDGSTDSSGEICVTLQETDSRIKIVNKSNGGVSSARNKGLDIATGKYVTFVDSDDFQEKNCINTLVNAIKNDRSQMSYGDFYVVQQSKKKIVDQYTKSNQSFIKGLLSGRIHGAVWNKLFDLSIINQFNIRFLDNVTMWEDLYFVFMYVLKCEKVTYIDFPIYNYFIDNSQSITKQGGCVKTINNKVYIATIISSLLDQEEYLSALTALKVRAKEGLILNQNTLNINLWNNTFLEIRIKNVVFNSNLRFLSKMLFISMRMRFYFIPSLALKIKKIKKQ